MPNLIFLFLILLSQLSFAINCHPNINFKLPQYIVGYGSLINEDSKRKTDPSAKENIPIMVKGYKRRWAIHGKSSKLHTQTFLSIIEDPRSSFNGVIYKLNKPTNIYKYDQREFVYCRKELKPNEISSYIPISHGKKQIWVYITNTKNNQKPTLAAPIRQSYVDIFVSGCIQMEEKFHIKNFAKDCVKNTDQWSKYWVNDRHLSQDRYLYKLYGHKIDSLLYLTLAQINK